MSAKDLDFSYTEPTSIQSLTFIVLVDVSGDSDKIDRVNHLLEELLPIERLLNNGLHSLKVAFLAFSDVCEWFPLLPVSPEDFVLEPFQAGGKSPCLGMAYQELARRMSNDDLFQSPNSFEKLALMLISDGQSVDDHKAGMKALSQNRWYQLAWKGALPLDSDANLEVLKEFIGKNGDVLRPYGSTSRLIDIIVVTAGPMSYVGEKQSPEADDDSYDDSYDDSSYDESLWI